MPAMLVWRTSWLRRWRGIGGLPPSWRHRRTAVRTRPPGSRVRAAPAEIRDNGKPQVWDYMLCAADPSENAVVAGFTSVLPYCGRTPRSASLAATLVAATWRGCVSNSSGPGVLTYISIGFLGRLNIY